MRWLEVSLAIDLVGEGVGREIEATGIFCGVEVGRDVGCVATVNTPSDEHVRPFDSLHVRSLGEEMIFDRELPYGENSFLCSRGTDEMFYSLVWRTIVEVGSRHFRKIPSRDYLLIWGRSCLHTCTFATAAAPLQIKSLSKVVSVKQKYHVSQNSTLTLSAKPSQHTSSL